MKQFNSSQITIRRFKTLAGHLNRELGEKLSMTVSGEVIVHAGPFSSECRFHSLQACIDSYARFLPSDFVNPS